MLCHGPDAQTFVNIKDVENDEDDAKSIKRVCAELTENSVGVSETGKKGNKAEDVSTVRESG